MTREKLIMAAKPILFNTEMVKAILDGRKTQTRRAIKDWHWLNGTPQHYIPNDKNHKIYKMALDKAKYQKGDILYVKERINIHINDKNETIYASDIINGHMASNYKVYCIADKMPKKYARIFLKVTSVRVERLQDISEEDCMSEGADKFNYCYTEDGEMFETHKEAFKIIWNSISKDGYKWEDNPYVFVYEFERIK